MNWLKTIDKEIEKVKKAYFKGWEGCEYKSCEVTILDTPESLKKQASEMVYIEHPEGVQVTTIQKVKYESKTFDISGSEKIEIIENEVKTLEFSGKKVLLVNKNKHLEI